jgi:F-type H+-transporting ATPase subunit delta
MIRYSRSQLARAFVRLNDTHPWASLTAALGQELVANHRTVDIDSVVAEIARHLLAMRRVLLAQVVVAHPLSSPAKRRLREILAQATGARRVQLEVKIDPGVIGGCVIRTPGRELDASVAGALKSFMKL